MSIASLTTALADRYRIEREFGAGGMATVYLAHDLRHERDVAIKVLHPDLGAALGAERFLSEIRTTARLQHPHILPLLDSGALHLGSTERNDGPPDFLYYVMPLVTGETLRARLDRERQLPVDDAVRIAREVADALGYAHGHGVIHRDIKPENILLQDGHALVADFGIALAVQTAAGQRMTQTGLSLGTPQYMSPEQAMGERTIDARSDLYALGAVTYEMLVGEAPFTGPSVQAIVARIMTEEPRALAVQRKAIPDHVEGAILRMLEKLPADRFATAAEFAAALANHSATAQRGTGSRRAAAPVRPARWRDPVVIGLAVLTLAAVTLATWTHRPGGDEPAQVVSFAMTVPQTGSAVLGYSSLSISRDGQLLVYFGQNADQRRLLTVRRIDETIERVLPGTENASHPVFSPDAEWIAYIRGNELYRIRTAGGNPELLGAVTSTFTGMSWSLNHRIYYSDLAGIHSIPDQGGQPALVLAVGTSGTELSIGNPFVDDETGMLYYSPWAGTNVGSAHIAMAPISGGTPTNFDLPGLGVVGVADGVMVYVSPTGALMAVPIDVAGKRITGRPAQLLQDVRINLTTGIPRVALSQNGTLFYERGSQLSRVVLAGTDGSEEALLAEPRDYAFPRLSPDGNMLSVTVGAGGRRDVWLYDLHTASPTRLTTDGTTNERSEWSPDGKRVLYRSDRDSRSSIWWRAADLSDQPTPLVSAPRELLYEGVISPDGRHVAYQLDTLGADIYYRALAGDTTPRPIAASPNAIEAMPRISPDGDWIAFTTDESGQESVAVQPFPGPGGRIQVSTGAGAQPVWSRDGSRLIYRAGGWFISARIQRSPRFAVVSRDTLFRDDYIYATNPHANFDVSPDGRRLVVLAPLTQGELVVVTEWRRLLRAAMAQAAAAQQGRGR
jgi:serine/threonine-protein kinase